MNSITKRWVRGSLLVTILMCLVAEAVFLYYSITNYYDGARRAMTTRTSTIITQLNASAAQTGESQGVLLRRMVEQFTEKDKFELMLVNAAGKPLVTSTGFAPDDSVAGEDYLEALASEKGEGHAVYRTAMGEKVMAVTTLLPRAAGEIVAVRFVTSLTLVDQSIAALVAFSLAGHGSGAVQRVDGHVHHPQYRAPHRRDRGYRREDRRGEIWTRVSKTNHNDEVRQAVPAPSTALWRAAGQDRARMKTGFISSVSRAALRSTSKQGAGWRPSPPSVTSRPKFPPGRAGHFQRGRTVCTAWWRSCWIFPANAERPEAGPAAFGPGVAEVSGAAIMVERRVELEGRILRMTNPRADAGDGGPRPAAPGVHQRDSGQRQIKYSHTALYVWTCCPTATTLSSISRMKGRALRRTIWRKRQGEVFKGKGAGARKRYRAGWRWMGSNHRTGRQRGHQSEVGRGTTVTVRLPVQAAGSVSAPPAAARRG